MSLYSPSTTHNVGGGDELVWHIENLVGFLRKRKTNWRWKEKQVWQHCLLNQNVADVGSIHPKSEKVCGFCSPVQNILRKRCVNLNNKNREKTEKNREKQRKTEKNREKTEKNREKQRKSSSFARSQTITLRKIKIICGFRKPRKPAFWMYAFSQSLGLKSLERRNSEPPRFTFRPS